MTKPFIIIPKFISPERADALGKEYMQFCEDVKETPDPQAELSYSTYGYITFFELLMEKLPEVVEIVGEPLFPTYCYSRIYKTGCDLKKHMDRGACEVSVTLHLEGDTDWPISIEASDGTPHSVILKPGDAMIYLGCVAPHWRTKYRGNEYVQFFMHYVRSRGACADVYFDKEDKLNNIERIEILTQEYDALR